MMKKDALIAMLMDIGYSWEQVFEVQILIDMGFSSNQIKRAVADARTTDVESLLSVMPDGK